MFLRYTCNTRYLISEVGPPTLKPTPSGRSSFGAFLAHAYRIFFPLLKLYINLIIDNLLSNMRSFNYGIWDYSYWLEEYSPNIPKDRAERHDFWSSFLLFILLSSSLFFRSQEKRGKEKPKTWSKVIPFC